MTRKEYFKFKRYHDNLTVLRRFKQKERKKNASGQMSVLHRQSLWVAAGEIFDKWQHSVGWLVVLRLSGHLPSCEWMGIVVFSTVKNWLSISVSWSQQGLTRADQVCSLNIYMPHFRFCCAFLWQPQINNRVATSDGQSSQRDKRWVSVLLTQQVWSP